MSREKKIFEVISIIILMFLVLSIFPMSVSAFTNYGSDSYVYIIVFGLYYFVKIMAVTLLVRVIYALILKIRPIGYTLKICVVLTIIEIVIYVALIYLSIKYNIRSILSNYVFPTLLGIIEYIKYKKYYEEISTTKLTIYIVLSYLTMYFI